MLESPRTVENKFPAPESVIATPSMVSISPSLSAHLMVKGRSAQLMYASQNGALQPLPPGGGGGGGGGGGDGGEGGDGGGGPTHLNLSFS